MRSITIIVFLVIPAMLFSYSEEYRATSIHLWGGVDLINAHASGTVVHPIAGTEVSGSAGGFGGGLSVLFSLDRRSAIGLETGYLLIESISEAMTASSYTEFIFPVLCAGQLRLIGEQGTSGMSIQGGIGLGVLYRTEARAYPYVTSGSFTNDGAGLLGYVGPQAELALAQWFSLEATARYYFTSLNVSNDKSMFYLGCGVAFTF